MSKAVVSLPKTPSMFKTQFSETVDDTQAEIELLRDLFSSSDSIVLGNDTLDSVSQNQLNFSLYNTTVLIYIT